ncbi:unnamed protein product [Ectocarpus sp. CCAP 1310/34]|nr:unnamed protein product [Ectocarpus sp. CCAP 1310/34]
MRYLLRTPSCGPRQRNLGARVSPALVKVVAGQGGRLLQPAVYKTERGTEGANDDSATVSVAAASSWSVLSWVERERFGLVSDLSPDNFMRTNPSANCELCLSS